MTDGCASPELYRTDLASLSVSRLRLSRARFKCIKERQHGYIRTQIIGRQEPARQSIVTQRTTAELAQGPKPTSAISALALRLEERALLSTVTVTNTNDNGPGSLRDAINNAVSGEVIDFAKSAYGTINLTSGPLAINFINLTIQGPGPNKLTISGGGNLLTFSS